jgi:glycine cleavage system H protein
MSEVPEGLLYTEEHEYVRATDEEGVYQIGVTDYAQGELGDIVFLELPAPGTRFDRMAVFGTIEAVKAVSELFAPMAMEVLEVNGALDADPAAVNRDTYGDGWMLRVRPTEPTELDSLLSAGAYRKHIGAE